MEKLFQEKKWKWTKVKKGKNVWTHPDFKIKILTKYQDNAFKSIEFSLYNLPSIEQVFGKKKYNVETSHIFEIVIPREYPANLGRIQILTRKKASKLPGELYTKCQIMFLTVSKYRIL